MTNNLEEIIKNLVEPLAEAQGLILWGITITPGPVLKVAVYVDTQVSNNEEAHASATIDQCETISKQLGLALEVEDCITQPWVLEVSSPGLERRFFSISQMSPYIGDILEIRLKDGTGTRKNWLGKLLEVGENTFIIQPCSISEEGVITLDKLPPQTINWDDVRNAHRVYVFTTPSKPGKPTSKRSGK